MNFDPLINRFIKRFSGDKENPEEGTSNLKHIFKRIFERDSSTQNNEILRKPGDLNNDGKVDFDDVLILKDVLDGKRELDEKELEYADLNYDGIVDYKDLNLMINLVIESRKAEDRVMELQGVYDRLQMKQEQGLAKSGIDKARIDTVKADLEQAIADFILQKHNES